MSYAAQTGDYDAIDDSAADDCRADAIQDSTDALTRDAEACYTKADALAALDIGLTPDLMALAKRGSKLAGEKILAVVLKDLAAHVKAYIEREADDAETEADRQAMAGAVL